MALEVNGLAPLLSVFDMPVAIRFYRDVLGFTVTGTSPALSDNPDHVNWSMLELSGATLMLNTAYDPEDQPSSPEPSRWVGHSDTCIYFGCPDVESAYIELRSKGVSLEPPKVAPYGMKQLYLTDPDGYGLCFQWKA
jgi:glyoxylase I family protein